MVAATRPKAASTVAGSLTRHEPSKMRNSATKLPRAGRPSEARAKTRATAPIPGAVSQRPPILSMSRVCRRSCMSPTMANSAPVEKAWQTISRTAPCRASVFQAMIASSTKPMWLTLV